MDDRAHFNSTIRFVRSMTSSLYTPRVDSYYNQKNQTLHYDIDVPGVQRSHLRAIFGYSAVLQNKNIAVWGASLAPYWPVQALSHSQEDSAELLPMSSPLMDQNSGEGEPDRPFSTVTNTSSSQMIPVVASVDRPMQRMMERNHGEFYRLLNVPAKTKVSDINVVLANGTLKIMIKCNKPLTANEVLATQEVIEVH
ncbi:hypothetical protein C8R41DRAFT_925472 [Lentinula lateritia]|uniref:SHSP domain-containing protein n=1 Tax=Lentinula lateritia TaxID=40482 RepID=A0ABQ8V415_9AGAR|nr:hypothetical protein C8R41DRAFT_925472 [Lentinula lateritia]